MASMGRMAGRKLDIRDNSVSIEEENSAIALPSKGMLTNYSDFITKFCLGYQASLINVFSSVALQPLGGVGLYKVQTSALLPAIPTRTSPLGQ